MDWSNESYVRLYIRDTVTWKRLRWQGQTVLMHLLRKVDRSGLMEGIEDTVLDISIMTGLPEDVVESGIDSLFKEGVFTQKGTTLFMPNFLDAQETPKSDRQRQRESREKRRLSQNVTEESQKVTNCHDVTGGVTSGHDVSLYPMPSCALPSSTNTIIQECKLTPKKKKTENSKSSHETTITYVEIFNEVFGRKIRSIGNIDKRVRELMANGYDDWKILIMPIIQEAIDPNTGTTRNFDPLMLLRTGEHGRTGENGATYGKTDWIQRAHGNADKFYADARLSKIAYKYGLADILDWMMKGIVKNADNKIPQMPVPGMAATVSRTGDRQGILPQSVDENRRAGDKTGAVQ